MFLSWALIGLIVGMLQGLTGAGGAVIAVPLFIHLTGASVHQATVLSLAAVASGAVANWIAQRRQTQVRTGLLIFLFSIAGSAAFRSIKSRTPETVIIALFMAVGTLALLGVWRKAPTRTRRSDEHAPGGHLVTTAISGFGLGAVVVMTGLGGGALLVPALIHFFGMSAAEATATSLLTIVLSSGSSMAMQWEAVAHYVSLEPLLILAIGSTVSAILIRRVMRDLKPVYIERARKWTITAVVLAAVGGLLL